MTDDIVKPIPPASRANTRQRMIAGAAELIRRKGLNVTSLRDVVEHVGASRGSIGHHFPGGKKQLLLEAIDFAGCEVSTLLARLLDAKGPLHGLLDFLQLWKQLLERNGFEAGCPLLIAAVEPYTGGERGRDDSVPTGAESLRARTAGVFAEWQELIADSLIKSGVEKSRAERLGNMAIASIEGCIAMCRATKSSRPLDDVQDELELIIMHAIDEGRYS